MGTTRICASGVRPMAATRAARISPRCMTSFYQSRPSIARVSLLTGIGRRVIGRAAGLEHFPIVGFVARHDLDVAEPLVYRPPRRARDPAMELLVGQNQHGRPRHAVE